MADARRLKRLRRAGLGPPPPPAEARADLAPAAAAGEGRSDGRIDGRRLRRSGRTLQFATRVSAAFDARLRGIAERDGLLLVEVLERALDAYERDAGRARGRKAGDRKVGGQQGISQVADSNQLSTSYQLSIRMPPAYRPVAPPCPPC